MKIYIFLKTVQPTPPSAHGNNKLDFLFIVLEVLTSKKECDVYSIHFTVVHCNKLILNHF